LEKSICGLGVLLAANCQYESESVTQRKSERWIQDLEDMAEFRFLGELCGVSARTERLKSLAFAGKSTHLNRRGNPLSDPD